MLSVIILSLVMLSAFFLSVIMLTFVLLSVIMLSVFLVSVILLSVILVVFDLTLTPSLENILSLNLTSRPISDGNKLECLSLSVISNLV